MPAPAEVFAAMKEIFVDPACRGSRHWKLLGQVLCGKGYMRLMGLGKHRFQTLAKAARKGEAYCPYDARFIPRGPKCPDPRRSKVTEFLQGLYDDVAEHIPDKLNSNKRPRLGASKFDPPDMDRTRLKHLPAGSISDYHRQCQEHIKDNSLSRKLFCLVSCRDSNAFVSLDFGVLLLVFFQTF